MKTADPRFAVNAQDSKLSRLVGAGLTAVDTPSLEPRLELAERVDEVAPLVFEFTVRADAKFADGAPVTAEDVAWTYASVLDPKTSSLHHRGFAERYVSVEARGPRVVRFTLKEPLATLMSDVDFAVLSKRTGLGAGPYRLRELKSTHALLEINPHYHGAKPLTPRVLIKFVPDASARLLMLVGGSADLLQNAARPDVLDDLVELPRVRLASAPSAVFTFLGLNTSHPILKDKRVRKAIALGIDREAIINAKFGGRARVAASFLPDFHWAVAKDLPRYTRDLPRAKRLLDEAGYPDPDGDGPRARFSLIYKTSSEAFRGSIARLLAAQLGAIGIDVEVRTFEWGTFLADVKKGSFHLATMQQPELTEPDYYYFYLHSSRIPTPQNPDAGNRWRYSNPRFDRLTEEGRREMNREKRAGIYAEAQHIIAEDLPIIALWHEDNVVLTNKDVQGYTITPNARYIGLVGTSKE